MPHSNDRFNDLRLMKKDHEAIASFLKTQLPAFSKKQHGPNALRTKKVSLEELLKRLPDWFGLSQEDVASKLEKESTDAKYTVDRATVSRIINRFNDLLSKFCKTKGIIPQIQLFSWRQIGNEKRPQHCKLFLACAEPVGTTRQKRTIAQNIVPFKRALKKSQPASQIKEFREQLRNEAVRHLIEKLHNRERDDYRPMGLEIGLLDRSRREEEGFCPQPADHNRIWGKFDCKQLENPTGVYILSSETGAGKTTFLRNLQLTIIDSTELIPLYLDASDLDGLTFSERNIDIFLRSLGKLFYGYLQDGHEEKFLKNNFDDIVFLIDGLDQITGSGTEYKSLIDKLLRVVEDKLIITSRPFAVIEKEIDCRIAFLRLNPFSEREAQIYFAKRYKRAKELCKTCSELLYIPMLAYMVRCLIEEGRDGNVKNRAGLYKEFIDYIFEEYSHNNRKVSKGTKSRIRDAFATISFKSIANVKPFLQKIPLSVAINFIDTNVEIDDLLKSGLAHTIVNRTSGVDEFLYFSHQSFQEYLAAEYIAQCDKRIQQVLGEKWNPKWKEVIKFLVGIRGQEIIETILSERDNPIHSKLFLSAELVPGAEISTTLKNKISQQLEMLLDYPSFREDAGMHLVCVDEMNAQDVFLRKLEDEDKKVVTSAIHALVKLNDRAGSKVIEKLVGKLTDEDKGVVGSAIHGLVELKDKVGSEVTERLVDKLEDKDRWVVDSTIRAFVELKDKVDGGIIEKIAERLDNEDKEVVASSIRALGELKDKVDSKIVEKIAGRLEDEDKRVVGVAIDALGELKDKVDSKVVEKIAGRLEDEESDIRSSAERALGKLKNKVDSKVVETIAERLEDNNKEVVGSAIRALGKLEDRVNSEVVEKIAEKLEDEEVVESALDALGELKNPVDGKIVEKIVDKLATDDSYIILLARSTLEKLMDNVGIEVVEKIAERLDDENKEVVGSAIRALGELKDKVGIEVVEKITEKLEDEDKGLVTLAIYTLGELKNKIDIDVVERIAGKLEDEDKGVVASALFALGELKDKVDVKIVEKIADKLKDTTAQVFEPAIYALVALKDKVDVKIVEKIAKRLDNEDYSISHLAIRAINTLKDKVNIEVVEKIAERLDDKNTMVVMHAMRALGGLKDKVDSKIVEKIAKRLDDESVVGVAIDALGELKDEVNGTIVEKIEGRLEDESKEVVKSAINALTELKDMVGIEAVEKIAGKLNDENNNVAWAAMCAIRQLNDKLDDKIVEKIVNKLKDKNYKRGQSETYLVLKALHEYGRLEFLQ